jgi:hypothetical protein
MKKVKKQAEAVNPIVTIGRPGTVITGKFVESYESNPALVNGRQYLTYSNLLANVSIVAAGVRYFLNLVSKARWKVVPKDLENPKAVEYAELVHKQLHRMNTPWTRVVRRAAMYRFYGFSIQEWTMEKSEDILQFLDVAPRPQATIEQWDRDENGAITAVYQRVPQTQELKKLPMAKLIYLVDDVLDDSPQGLGLFRHIVDSCARLRRYEQLEGFGFESDLRGIPVGRGPFALLQQAVESGLISKTDKAEAEAPILDFITNHIKNPSLGLLLDSLPYQSQDDTPSGIPQWDLDVLKGSSSSLPDMAKAIERVNREIARILGVEGLLLGEQTTGSHALSSDKALNFALIVASTLGELKDTFQKEFINRFFDLNGFDKDLIPDFDTEALQHRDITQVTQALKDLADAGAPLDPNDPATNAVRELLGLPEQPKVDPADAIARRENLKATVTRQAGEQPPATEPGTEGA